MIITIIFNILICLLLDECNHNPHDSDEDEDEDDDHHSHLIAECYFDVNNNLRDANIEGYVLPTTIR